MKRILVALDGSPRAQVVLDAAARLANLTDAKLVLFRAIGVPPELPPDLISLPPIRIEETLRSTALASLDRIARTVSPALIESITTSLGTAWDAIVREAKAVDADLIMIGSHGYGGLDRLIGTTAAKVVNHADRNVLVVRTVL